MPEHDITYRDFAIQAATDLFYGETVLRRIREARTDEEICRIMKNERERESELITGGVRDEQ